MTKASGTSVGTLQQVIAPSADLRRAPHTDAPLETQLLFGERFNVHEAHGEWLQGAALLDGYEGFVERSKVKNVEGELTHRVSALCTHRFSEPDLKSRPLSHLSMNAKLVLTGELHNGFLCEGQGGWVSAKMVAPLEERVDDYVVIAERYLGAPYLWGGREYHGLDCSALLQNAFERTGTLIPRDSGPQEAYFRSNGSILLSPVAEIGELSLQRGDIVFWSGHVAILVNTDEIVHANATAMAVSIDVLSDFISRVQPDAGVPTAIVRPQM